MHSGRSANTRSSAGIPNPARTGHRSGSSSRNLVPSHSFGSYAQSPWQSTDPSSSLGTAENPVENQRVAYSVRPSAQAYRDLFPLYFRGFLPTDAGVRIGVSSL